MNNARGIITKHTDTFGTYYRIHTGDIFGQFYSTNCYQTAMNMAKELLEKK
jgi:hypothetical protein